MAEPDGPDPQSDGRLRLAPLPPQGPAPGAAAVSEGHDGGIGVRVGGGGRVYALFLLLAAAAVLTAALGDLFVLATAVPGTAAAAGRPRATTWRLLRVAAIQNLPRSLMIMAPFALTYAMGTRELLRNSLALAAGWVAFYGLLYWPAPGSTSPSATALGSVASGLLVPLNLLPLWLTAGLPKRGEATEGAVMRVAFVGSAALFSLFLIVEFFVPGASMGSIVAAGGLLSYALYRDSDVQLEQSYIAVLVAVTTTLPLIAFVAVVVLVENLDQNDPLVSLATVSALSLLLLLVFQFQYAFARRGLPAKDRAVALFPVQVFEDVFAEFFFANARVYSGGFFVLLTVQIVRTLGRDTGAFDEAKRGLGNWWRARRGEAAEARADDAVVEWTRIWLQNMVSELTAMFVFVGAILGEELRGDDAGTLTELGHGDRIALLGGYGVVFLFEAAAHAICFVVLRRAVQREQARLAVDALDSAGRDSVAALRVRDLSIGAEAQKLVERHGLYLLATLLAVTYTTLYYVRLLRVGYD